MNTTVAVTDETLCALLDGELSAEEANAVRAALRENAALAERLAELASADAYVRQQASQADAAPLPASLRALLDANEPSNGNVLDFRAPAFWRARARPLALAASLVAAVALVFSYLGMDRAPAGATSILAYADALESAPSGREVQVQGTAFTSRFSFQDTEQRYCRVFTLQSANEQSDNLACRDNGYWTLIVSTPGTASAGGYQPATASSPLDSQLDQLMQGSALGLDAEAALIERQWQP